jgi:hypothetical protein
MAYRYTNTDKWNDAWFAGLRPIQKLLFIYLCDNCDIAGFIEANIKRWALDIGYTVKDIEGALKGLSRSIVEAKTGDCFYIRNFIKHQKNLPLNENNKSHLGIIRRFEQYSHKFDIKDINEFIQRGYEGACKGLLSPTGNGNGNINITNLNKSDEDIAFAFYKSEADEAKKFTDQESKDYVEFARYVCAKKDGQYRMRFFLKMSNQLSLAEYHKLRLKAKDAEEIKSMADSIQVKKQYHGKYEDVYKTFNNWLNRR